MPRAQFASEQIESRDLNKAYLLKSKTGLLCNKGNEFRDSVIFAL